MFRCGMVLEINKPTRVTRYIATAIDHVYKFYYKHWNKISCSKDRYSDHFPVFFVAKVNVDVDIITEQYILKRNIYVINGMILKYLTMSIILVIDFSKIFFHSTMNVFRQKSN